MLEGNQYLMKKGVFLWSYENFVVYSQPVQNGKRHCS